MSVKVTSAMVVPVPTTDNLVLKVERRRSYRNCVICWIPTASRTVPPADSKLSPIPLCSWCAHIVTDVTKLPTTEQVALWNQWAVESDRFRQNVLSARARNHRKTRSLFRQ